MWGFKSIHSSNAPRHFRRNFKSKLLALTNFKLVLCNVEIMHNSSIYCLVDESKAQSFSADWKVLAV